MSVSSVFNKDEMMIDVTSCTRGHGYQDSYPLGCTRLPKKTHRGLRKDVCTGTWHSARVQWQVRRASQYDFHHGGKEMTKRRARRWKVRSERRKPSTMSSKANRSDCVVTMQIVVKTLTGKTTTFDVEGQRHHRRCEDKEGIHPDQQ